MRIFILHDMNIFSFFFIITLIFEVPIVRQILSIWYCGNISQFVNPPWQINRNQPILCILFYKRGSCIPLISLLNTFIIVGFAWGNNSFSNIIPRGHLTTLLTLPNHATETNKICTDSPTLIVDVAHFSYSISNIET